MRHKIRKSCCSCFVTKLLKQICLFACLASARMPSHPAWSQATFIYFCWCWENVPRRNWRQQWQYQPCTSPSTSTGWAAGGLLLFHSSKECELWQESFLCNVVYVAKAKWDFSLKIKNLFAKTIWNKKIWPTRKIAVYNIYRVCSWKVVWWRRLVVIIVLFILYNKNQ